MLSNMLRHSSFYENPGNEIAYFYKRRVKTQKTDGKEMTDHKNVTNPVLWKTVSV